MRLVMVHGRKQGGNDPKTLEKEWLDALHYGLARADLTLPPSTIIEFPFYGDELESLVQQASIPLGSDVNAKGVDTDAEKNLRGEVLIEFASAIGLTDTDIMREFAGQPQEKGPQNWEWVQAILRAIDRVPGLNSTFIDCFARDVYVYLTYPGVRAKIDEIVNTAIGNEPCVVIAHSLGTIVAFNALRKRAKDSFCPRLVTVGSPLGIKAIKRQLESPLKSPSCVGHWFNAYDDRDVVALVPLDIKNFNILPSIENKSDVINFTDNHHGISGYLADPIVASKIIEFL